MWRFYPTTTTQQTPTSDVQQLEEMFCQREATYELNSVSAHPLKKGSSTPRKCKPLDLQQKPVFVDKFLDPQSPEFDESLAKEHENSETGIEILKAQRHLLEKDVFGLQNRLQQEVDLHYALENAFRQEAAVTPAFDSLPLHAQELVTDIALLEVAIAHLEQQIDSLNLQLGYEQRERQRAEGSLMKLPMHVPNQEDQHVESSCNPFDGELVSSLQQPCCSTVSPLTSPLSPRFSDTPSPSKGSFMSVSAVNYGSPAKQLLFEDFYSNNSPLQPEHGISNPGCKHVMEQPDLVSPEKLKPKTSIITYHDHTTGNIIGTDLKNSWLQPNKLSQDMVNCMISIYRHLADPTDKLPLKKTSSPTSHYGNVTASSISSISESSLSFNPSPSTDAENKNLGHVQSFDPYKTPEKLAWPDIGSYSTAVEVSEMLVGKEQLEYAAEALRTFRSLVEQLSQVDPSSMKHNEKLAFWINVYNALMMHAYLAYGIPKNDFKFFSLMQKAAYTVGGHSFNAVVIEHLLLKAKAQWYRPQIALLLAHQKLKLRDEVSMFAIDRVEPLVTFSLSFGASSSPAVRVYTAENVHEELQLSLKEYARASVGLSVRGKLLIPKLLFDFACEVVDDVDVPEWICQFLPSQQSSLIRNCIKHRQHKFLNSKHFSVIPFDFRFRYLFLLRQMRNTGHRTK